MDRLARCVVLTVGVGFALGALLGPGARIARAQPARRPVGLPVKAPRSPPPPPAVLPSVGDRLPVTGTESWPKLDWLYGTPAPSDAAGKVVIHWFCAPKVQTCSDDLARIVTLREAGRVYVVGYINGSKRDAQKLDPIRASEGVGRGTVAFGRGATGLMKQLGVAGPASIVVDVDGKVVLVSTGSAPTDLDARDARVNAAVAAAKDYVSAIDGPTQVKPGDKFQLSIAITLASWLKYSDKTQMEMALTVPPDLKCDATVLRAEQIKVVDRVLTATATCSGPHGSYEARGELRFGYDTPGGGTGIGAESAKWKFEIKN